MNTNLKKAVAICSIAGLVAMNAAYAATGSIGNVYSGATVVGNVVYDDILKDATGSTNVSVTATVAPTLSMTLNTSAIDLGQLPTDGSYASGTVTVATATNSANGAQVSMGSNGLESATHHIGTLSANGKLLAGGTNDYRFTKDASNVSDGGTSAQVVASTVILNGTTIANSNVTTTVKVGAKASALTEAGTYGDTLVFTVTASF